MKRRSLDLSVVDRGAFGPIYEGGEGERGIA
jgi:hypothetical protein